MVRCNESDEVDMPVEAPAYTSYTDPNTGEPSPTYGARTPLPNPAWWGEDMQRVARSAQASTPRSEPKKRTTREHVSKRKSASVARREAENAEVPNEFEEAEEDDEEEEEFVPLTKEQIAATATAKEVVASGDQLWYTKNDIEHDPIKEAMHQMQEEHEEEMAEEAQEEEPEAILSKEDEALAPTLGESEQLSNSELWWNWQKPDKDKEPWSAWHKRSGDSDSVSSTLPFSNLIQ